MSAPFRFTDRAARTLAGEADAEEEAPRVVCDAIDALLGVALDSCAG